MRLRKSTLAVRLLILMKCSGPQIFIGETDVGGFTDLYALHQKGDLLPLLQAE